MHAEQYTWIMEISVLPIKKHFEKKNALVSAFYHVYENFSIVIFGMMNDFI